MSPVAQPARRILFHLRQRVSEALDALKMEVMIRKVIGPTPFLSPFVVVPKKNGDVQLCVDMRMANLAIQ